ncbi:hypothetical protein GCK72_006664 [Caenorhabditis remanei]|uniref:Uncharacterized protein n=1 Tax=Caenorhabditis remanei TaxID=31234 RepID=A0A6A5HJ46_CAERE|nr:hypothetical protein GCK72_006664 [Caenorhabditis remanei]KAF1766706.1 hypothetical protein GCK72_006664 [Caenorhabditis remanei]
MLSGAKLPWDILFGFPLLILWNSLLGVVPTSSFPNPSGTEFDCSPVPQEGSVVAVAQESWGGRGSGLCDAKVTLYLPSFHISDNIRLSYLKA